MGGSGWSEVPSHVRSRLRRVVLERDGYVCQLQLKCCTYKATQADHIRPAAIHGHGIDNLQGACWPCNRAKGEPLDDTDPAPLPSAW